MSQPAEYLFAEEVDWDITCYADKLLKNPLKSGTKAPGEKETELRW